MHLNHSIYLDVVLSRLKAIIIQVHTNPQLYRLRAFFYEEHLNLLGLLTIYECIYLLLELEHIMAIVFLLFMGAVIWGAFQMHPAAGIGAILLSLLMLFAMGTNKGPHKRYGEIHSHTLIRLA